MSIETDKSGPFSRLMLVALMLIIGTATLINLSG